MILLQMCFHVDPELRKKIRQVFPVLCGCVIQVTLGMMLGWPSPAYPYLLQWNISPIPITLDQTSLIAGFLMEGNSIGTLFSTSKFLSSKIAVLFCCCLQFFGWCVMFGANDIFGLLVSRMSVGFAAGYGTGQLKRYIKETCDCQLAESLINLMPLGVNVGVILIYMAGIFLTFRTLAVFSAVISVLGAIAFAVIPKKPKRAIKKRAEIIKDILGKRQSFDVEKLEESLSEEIPEPKQLSVFKCLLDTKIRNALLLIFLLVFIQQYTGGPANIVYSEIIFRAAGNSHPKICSIMYATFSFFTSLISLLFAKATPRKINTLISCGGCTIVIGVLSLYFHVKHDLLLMSSYFVWAPLFILMLFNLIHTFGISTVPLLIIDEKVPKQARNVLNKFWVIHFSMSSVISNKIFQILFGAYNMAVGYAFFMAVALVGCLAVLIFMDDYDPTEEKRKSELLEDKIDCEIGHVEISKL